MTKTFLVSPALTTLFTLCLTALGFGCNSGGSELEDTARNISRRSTQRLQHADQAADDEDDEDEGEGEETDYSAATDQGVAGSGAEPEMEGAGEDSDSAEAESGAGSESDDGAGEDSAAAMPGAGPASDDSVRCGNGLVDSDELCDIRIEAGEEGACPQTVSDCEPLDACHGPAIEIRGCRTQCVQGAPVEC